MREPARDPETDRRDVSSSSAERLRLPREETPEAEAEGAREPWAELAAAKAVAETDGDGEGKPGGDVAAGGGEEGGGSSAPEPSDDSLSPDAAFREPPAELPAGSASACTGPRDCTDGRKAWVPFARLGIMWLISS